MPLNLQLFGTKKSKETRAAERFFRERGVAPHVVDLAQKGMSAGELRNVAARVGGFEALIDRKDSATSTRDSSTRRPLDRASNRSSSRIRCC